MHSYRRQLHDFNVHLEAGQAAAWSQLMSLRECQPIDQRVSQVCSHLTTLTNCHW